MRVERSSEREYGTDVVRKLGRPSRLENWNRGRVTGTWYVCQRREWVKLTVRGSTSSMGT